MSEWPKRYEPSLNIESEFSDMFESLRGDYVETKDFDRLLKFTVGLMSTLNYTSGEPPTISDEQIKANILKILKMESER